MQVNKNKFSHLIFLCGKSACKGVMSHCVFEIEDFHQVWKQATNVILTKGRFLQKDDAECTFCQSSKDTPVFLRHTPIKTRKAKCMCSSLWKERNFDNLKENSWENSVTFPLWNSGRCDGRTNKSGQLATATTVSFYKIYPPPWIWDFTGFGIWLLLSKIPRQSLGFYWSLPRISLGDFREDLP